MCKRNIIEVLLALLATSCTVPSNSDVPKMVEETSFTGICRFDFQGHTYIRFYGYHQSGVVHDPDCKCFKKNKQ